MNNNISENKQEHKRRIHYSGTHPKRFEEKYKEANPEKYAETIEKVISKGNTPAGMHISICVNEILDFLQIKPGEKGLDATLGYGGHTLQMLKKLEHSGHMYALDVDPIEIEKTTERLRLQGFGPEILTVKKINFKDIDIVSKEAGKFDFVLADLGVSSMQIDNPERGFTYKYEGPLDLRLNPEKGKPAYEVLAEITEDEFESMLIENSDEPLASEIAHKVMELRRKGTPVKTTTDLKNAVDSILPKIPDDKRKELLKKTCQRTFQALRIDVNNEFEVLYEFLEKLPDILAPGGRAVILTFHSGEDRLVKKCFKEFKKQNRLSDISKDVIRPSAEECIRNPRARSTKMRWAIK